MKVEEAVGLWVELKKAHFRGVYRVKVPLPTILHRETICSGGCALSALCHGKYDRFYPPSSSFSSFSLLSDCLGVGCYVLSTT